MGHAVRASLVGQATVDAMFRQAGVIQVDTLDEMFDVAQLVAHQPLPGRTEGGDRRELRRSRSAGRRRGRRGRPARSDHPSRSVRTHPAATSRPRWPPRSTTLRWMPSSPSTSPRSTRRERRSPTSSPRSGSGPRSRSCRPSSPPRACPSCFASPMPRAARPDAGSVPSYGSPEAAVRALARAVGYAQWLDRPEAEPPGDLEVRDSAARAAISARPRRGPRGACPHRPGDRGDPRAASASIPGRASRSPHWTTPSRRGRSWAGTWC